MHGGGEVEEGRREREAMFGIGGDGETSYRVLLEGH